MDDFYVSLPALLGGSGYNLCGQFPGTPPIGQISRITCQPQPITAQYVYIQLDRSTNPKEMEIGWNWICHEQFQLPAFVFVFQLVSWCQSYCQRVTGHDSGQVDKSCSEIQTKFCDFVYEMSARFNDPTLTNNFVVTSAPSASVSKQSSSFTTAPVSVKPKNIVSSRKTVVSEVGVKCPIHNGDHMLTDCRVFRKKILCQNSRVHLKTVMSVSNVAPRIPMVSAIAILSYIV